MSVTLTHVVAAVILNERGEFLLSSRPEGKAYAGFWEFAGGKVEAGETELAALQRELNEELGITITHATPWLTKIYRYEHAHVYLRFFRVQAHQWHGDLQCRELQQYSWQQVGRFDVFPMLPANGPILRALALPMVWHGNDAQGFVGDMGAALVLMSAMPEADVRLLDSEAALQHEPSHLQLLPWPEQDNHEACLSDGWWWRPVNESQIQLLLATLLQTPVDMPLVVILEADLALQAAVLQEQGVHVAYVSDAKLVEAA